MNLALDMLVVRARRPGVPLPRAMIFTLILTISFNHNIIQRWSLLYAGWSLLHSAERSSTQQASPRSSSTQDGLQTVSMQMYESVDIY